MSEFEIPLPTVPWVAALHDLVLERLGYDVPEHRMTLEIAPRVLAHAETHGHVDPRELIDAIRKTPGGKAWDAVVRLVTVGETYFFRHAEQLTTLAAHLAHRATTAGEPLRIWSAGCATGEEPYSLAMLLEEAQVPYRITASDVDDGALAKAKAASGYSDRSLGHLPARLRERWMEPGATGRWRIAEREALPIRFVRHNLVLDAPLRPEDREPWDAILCRNVLLYFAADTGHAVIQSLGRTLAPEGGLWVGPCDHVPDHGPGLRWDREDDERLLRAYTGREPRHRVPAPRRATSPAANGTDRTAALIEKGLYTTAHQVLEDRLREQPGDGEALVLLGALQLQEHAFEKSLDTFRAAAQAHPKPAGVEYLRGIALLKSGRMEEARTAFGAALEDDADDWASSYQLATLYRRTGRTLREEVMLLRAADRLGAERPRNAIPGSAATLVRSVHSDPALAHRLVRERLTQLGAAPPDAPHDTGRQP